ncbi:MAG: MFS transporter, partial [Deltaproteobacteria bacterium]|nr:MFS transporter [Deltaproteobacteria bacterium]
NSQMGLIGTCNFIGYMLAVALAGFTSKRLGARRTIAFGLFLVALTMVAISWAETVFAVQALYFLTGIGSGIANVPMMGLVSHWFLKSMRGKAAGIMLSGNGLAIVFAGFFVPFINHALGAQGWRSAWLIMGVMTAGFAVMAFALLRNEPEEKNLLPLGKAKIQTPAGGVGVPTAGQAKKHRGTLIHLGLIYAIFGSTYVVYATFIVVSMVKERGFGEGVAGSFWAAVGFLGIFSGPLFGWISDHLGRKRGIIIAYSLFTVAYALVATGLPNVFLYLSVFIFGVSVWSLPTIMSAAVGDYMGPAEAAKSFAFITLFFGGGQIIGPALAGYLADLTGSFNTAFGLCAVLTATGVLLTLFLRAPEELK